MKRRVAAQQQYLCGRCKKLLDEHHEIDHKQPLWNGGTNDRSNLWALCSACHKDKTAQENNWRFHFKLTQTADPGSSQAKQFVPPSWEAAPDLKDANYYLPNYF
jgi:5-methylcytosine-specific restriction endonuclease McrA